MVRPGVLCLDLTLFLPLRRLKDFNESLVSVCSR